MQETMPGTKKEYRPSKVGTSTGRKVFQVINLTVLILLALSCLLPFVNVLAVSFSNNTFTDAGLVTLWPMGFNTQSYMYLLSKGAFWNAFRISVVRLVLGTTINMLILCLAGYPLSRPSSKFRGRTIYAWYFFITMLVNGGLIPNYMVVSTLKLRDTIWALVLPCAVQVYDLILILNFFRQVPIELEEASFLDGAGHFRTLVQVFIPVSMPAIATMILFCMVFHWNAWYDGMLYMNSTQMRPLQTYLRQTLIQQDFAFSDGDEMALFADINDRSLRCAQIIIATIPILCTYPFLQKYFVTGITLGSVKG